LIDENVLIKRLNDKYASLIRFAGHSMVLDASGTLFWPEFDLLIFSDLHFEKGSFLSQFAHPLPRLDTRTTLTSMQKAISIYQAQHVVCLGDSFHDGNAVSRMEPDNIACINRMVKETTLWQWVLGNHDPQIPPEIAGHSIPFLCVSNVLLVHEPEDIQQDSEQFSAIDAQIIGHFHPKVRTKQLSQTMTGKCFVQGKYKLLMPAFGQYTGGLWASDEVIVALVSNKARYHMMYSNKLYSLK